ncbi:MAG: YHS domain-containing (seleno)protein, partial [Planctomycetota bacterium]
IGSAKFTVKHNGAAYRFASEANKLVFEENPNAYLPQFGGFCAFGVTVGKKFDGDPRLFALVDGKLYFNLNPDIQKMWSQDAAGNIGKAEGQWSKIRNKSASEL